MRKGWGEKDQFYRHFAVFFSISSGKDFIFDLVYRLVDMDLTPYRAVALEEEKIVQAYLFYAREWTVRKLHNFQRIYDLREQVLADADAHDQFGPHRTNAFFTAFLSDEEAATWRARQRILIEHIFVSEGLSELKRKIS